MRSGHLRNDPFYIVIKKKQCCLKFYLSEMCIYLSSIYLHTHIPFTTTYNLITVITFKFGQYAPYYYLFYVDLSVLCFFAFAFLPSLILSNISMISLLFCCGDTFFYYPLMVTLQISIYILDFLLSNTNNLVYHLQSAQILKPLRFINYHL